MSRFRGCGGICIQDIFLPNLAVPRGTAAFSGFRQTSRIRLVLAVWRWIVETPDAGLEAFLRVDA
jgi:hypothetical protein